MYKSALMWAVFFSSEIPIFRSSKSFPTDRADQTPFFPGKFQMSLIVPIWAGGLEAWILFFHHVCDVILSIDFP